MTEMTEMTYGESANGQMVTWSRCVRELQAHGMDTVESVQRFAKECWNEHCVNSKYPLLATIDAKHLMDWLGY